MFDQKGLCLVEWGLSVWQKREYDRYPSLSFPSLQHTATHCNTLQHTATHCNTLQHTATHCNTLQHTRERGDLSYREGYLSYRAERMPYLSWSFAAKEPYNQWLFCRKRPATLCFVFWKEACLFHKRALSLSQRRAVPFTKKRGIFRKRALYFVKRALSDTLTEALCDALSDALTEGCPFHKRALSLSQKRTLSCE